MECDNVMDNQHDTQEERLDALNAMVAARAFPGRANNHIYSFSPYTPGAAMDQIKRTGLETAGERSLSLGLRACGGHGRTRGLGQLPSGVAGSRGDATAGGFAWRIPVD